MFAIPILVRAEMIKSDRHAADQMPAEATVGVTLYSKCATGIDDAVGTQF